MPSHWDAIVIGAGGFGSSCLYHLAKSGARVLGLDRFLPGHDRGSSHGETRIIRQAYFEHSDYVPLLRRSYELWRELESESGRSLMTICGLMQAGPVEGEVVPGVRRAAVLYGIPIENFSAEEALRRFPGFCFRANGMTTDLDVVLEPGAGYLSVEDCVRTHVEQACRYGAQLSIGPRVIGWESNGGTVTVTTESGTHTAAALIVTPGAWAPSLLGKVPGWPTIEVRRKVVLWSPVRSAAYSANGGGVMFLFELPSGVFYGFPSLDDGTLKVGEHSRGELVGDPLQVDRSLRADDVDAVASFLRVHLPDVETTPQRHSVCMYSMTPDGHFVVDRHPEFSNVFFGAGFSGHGFKFTSAIGESLAQWAATGSTTAAIEFLGLKRFAK